MNKVLHINKAFSIIGGVEKYIRDVTSYDYSNVGQVDVLAISNNIYGQRISLRNGEAIECGKLFTLASAPFSLTFMFRFCILALKYNVLHFHFPNPIGEIMLVIMRPFLFRKKIVVTYHNDVSSEKPFSNIYNRFAKLFFRSVHKILVTSPNLGRSSKVLREFQEKIEVVPLGIYFDNNPYKKSLEVHVADEPPQLKILFVGRLASVKGIDYLVKAVKDLNVLLTIVGSGDKSEYLRDLALRIGAENVYFAGELNEEDLVNRYQSADLFVLPSVTRGEGFGYVVLEAMVHGCAIITTELGTGTSFVNISEETGLVVTPASVDDLKKAIERFNSDRNFLISCSRRAQIRVNDFTIRQLINRLDQVYKIEDI